MVLKRITKHPILEIPESKEVAFTWNGKKLTGYEGEMISAALFANGIHIFGHHPKDNSPQGMFCANGQDAEPQIQSVKIRDVDVLIIGAGPAGLAAAVELGKLGVDTLIIDDKDRPGGKLVLQTHDRCNYSSEDRQTRVR
jgi:threonine dehydrogenase-like Zn-dependent dehydrogenase